MTAGQSTQLSAVSCGDPAQNLQLFPREALSLVVGRGAFGGSGIEGLAGGLLPVPPGNFAELPIRV